MHFGVNDKYPVEDPSHVRIEMQRIVRRRLHISLSLQAATIAVAVLNTIFLGFSQGAVVATLCAAFLTGIPVCYFIERRYNLPAGSLGSSVDPYSPLRHRKLMDMLMFVAAFAFAIGGLGFLLSAWWLR